MKVKDICEEFNIRLFEDSCEALGSKIKDKNLGSFGLASTFSFYYGHHISTIEGGMICTDSFEFSQIITSLRSHGWVRDLEKISQIIYKNSMRSIILGICTLFIMCI